MGNWIPTTRPWSLSSEDQLRLYASSTRRLHQPHDLGRGKSCDRTVRRHRRPKGKISLVRDTYKFRVAEPPSEFVAAFRKYYGPTMNAFEAAEKNGRSEDLKEELDDLFNRENKSPAGGATIIPATFLRVTIAR